MFLLSRCCCCLAAQVGVDLASSQFAEDRRGASCRFVGPGWARADQVLVCLQTSLFVYKHCVLIWFLPILEQGLVMAMGEDRMTWLGSMVRVMVQVDSAHLIFIWTKSVVTHPTRWWQL